MQIQPRFSKFFHAPFSHGFISSIDSFHLFQSAKILTWHHFTLRLFSACNKVEEARAGSPVPSTSTEAEEPSSPTLAAAPFIESLIKYSLFRAVSHASHH